VVGTEQEELSTLEGLMAARGFIRTEIRYRMNVRHVPEITFAIDRSDKINSRMDELLGRMEKRRTKLAEKVAKETTKPTGTGK
jgi:ribosome-binding factor A